MQELAGLGVNEGMGVNEVINGVKVLINHK